MGEGVGGRCENRVKGGGYFFVIILYEMYRMGACAIV